MSEREWIGPPNSASAWTALASPSDTGLIRLAFREAADRIALASQLERWRAALARVQADVLMLPDIVYDGGIPVLTFPTPAVVGANLSDAHSFTDTIARLGEVAEALDALHDSGLVHGALAGHSLWWSSTGRLRFPDAGLAHALEGVVGPPAEASQYRAPEFWHGQARTRFSDQYALAVMAYEWLTGHKREVDRSVEGVTSIEPLLLEPSALRAAGAPLELADVLQRALSFTPTARYATCREFVDELRAHTAILPKAEPLPEKGLRWGWRLSFQSWATVARIAAAMVVMVLLASNIDPVRRAATFSWLKRLAPMTRVEVRSPQASAQSRTPEEMLRGIMPDAGRAGSNSSGQPASKLSMDSLRSAVQRGSSLASPELPTVLVDVKDPALDAARLLDGTTGSSSNRTARNGSPGVSDGRVADSRSPASSAKLPPVRVPTLFIGGADTDATNASAAGTSARVDSKEPAILLLTVPTDSRVYIDGVMTRNKTQVAVAPGSHDITVLTGGKTVQRRVSLAAGDTVTVRLAMP